MHDAFVLDRALLDALAHALTAAAAQPAGASRTARAAAAQPAGAAAAAALTAVCRHHL